MGIDYKAFSGFGVVLGDVDRKKYPDPVYDLLELIAENDRDYFEIAEWGARNYGGHGGFILYVKSTYKDIGFDEPGVKVIDPGDMLMFAQSLLSTTSTVLWLESGISAGSPGWVTGMWVY